MNNYEEYKQNIENINVPDITQTTIDFLKKLSENLENLIKSDLSENEKNALNEYIANKKNHVLKQILILHKTLIGEANKTDNLDNSDDID